MSKLCLIIVSMIFSICLSYSQECYKLHQNVEKLYEKGQIKEAIKIAEKGILVCAKELGNESSGYATSLDDLGMLYDEIGNFEKAEQLYIKALTIRKLVLGEENAEYTSTLSNLASLYANKGDYKKSEIFYLKTLEIRNKILGEENMDYITSLNNLAVLYYDMHSYDNAEIFYKKTLSILKKVLGEEDPFYASVLYNLSVLYYDLKNYSQAEQFLIKVISIQEKVLGEKNSSYITSLEKLASLYHKIGIYSKSLNLNIKVFTIRKNVLGEENPDCATSLNNLAYLYSEMGNYEMSEKSYLQALTIINKAFGEEHPHYSSLLNNLAYLYGQMGHYEKEESLYQKSVKIRKKVLGEEHPDYAASLSGLASFYSSINNYEKAEPLYLQALSIIKKVLGEKDPKYASSINNLAYLYSKIGNFEKAEELYLQSISLRKNILGEEHPDYASSLNNLASLYIDLNKHEKAEELYLQSISLRKKVLGEEHPDYASSLNNLAYLYSEMRNYDKAKPLYLQSISILKKVLGEEHPHYQSSLYNLALIYDKIDSNTEQANKEYSYILKNIKKDLVSKLSFLSSNEVDIFMNSNEFYFESILSFLSRHPKELVKSDLFDYSIFRKNLLFNTNYLVQKTITSLNDSSINLIYKFYKDICIQINKQIQLPIEDQKILPELKKQKDSVEKELLISLPNFKELLYNNKISWSDIKSKMKLDQAFLNFVSYKDHDGRFGDTVKFGIFIIRPEWELPRFINLFNEDQLALLIDSTNTSFSINNLYCSNNGLTDSTCNSALYNLIWQPMDSLLKGVKKVFISPSGLLNRVSFSAIPTPEGGRLIDHYSIEQLSNIRTIAETNATEVDSIKSMVLIGGANFDLEPTFSDRSNVNYVSTDTLFSAIRALYGSKWSYLAGTENEVSAIKNIASPNKMSLSLLTGGNASEENFKKIGSANVPAPSVIHIATHGFAFATPKKIPKEDRFFLQDNRNNVFRMSEDPLTRAGLVMAGGNQVWSTGLPYPNHEDGILTAREVSEMNLKGCLLATLSACETGLGEIKGSEGVFGLQRAFKMAGVKYLIVSLWKVPDAQTKEFMELFYTSWLIQKLPIRNAFRQTQITMSKKYSPYQWAAFVLME